MVLRCVWSTGRSGAYRRSSAIRRAGTNSLSCTPIGRHHSDDAIVAAIDRNLRAGRPGEERPAQLGGEFRDIVAGDLNPQNIVGLILLDAHAVTGRALLEHLLGP